MATKERNLKKGCEIPFKEDVQKIRNAWREFISSTNKLSEGTPIYSAQRDELAHKMALIPRDCLDYLKNTIKKGDPWKRNLFDVTLDDIFLELSKEYPDHPQVVAWISSRKFWKELEKSKSKDLPSLPLAG